MRRSVRPTNLTARHALGTSSSLLLNAERTRRSDGSVKHDGTHPRPGSHRASSSTAAVES